MKGVHDISAAAYTNYFDLSGRLAFHSSINLPPSDNTYYIVVIMDKVIRQTNPVFRSCLENLRHIVIKNDDV